MAGVYADASMARRRAGMRSRVVVLAAVWVLQTLPCVLLVPLIVNKTWTVEGYLETLAGREMWQGVGVGAGVVAGAQGLFLWRVRRPWARREGRSIWLSVAVAAFLCGVLTVAGAISLVSVADMLGLGNTLSGDAFGWGLVGVGVLAWVVWTPIMAAFCRRGQVESALARLSARLFL